MTLDGRVNVPSGGGRVTGSAARRHVHELRDSVDAVITGAESIRVDDSRLTVRPPPEDGRQPIGVVFDSLARTNPDARIFQSEADTLVLTTQAAPLSRVRSLEQAGATVIECPSEESNRICVDSALTVLGNRGLTTVLLEAGPTLTRAFLDADAVDQSAVFVAAWTMGSGQLAPISVSELQKDCSFGQVMHLVGPDLLFLSDERRYGPGAA
jgi:diaminohydroxyphosphoribosylaminopyrimidine deaminase/5-amino-6-(5-phosphoribosylamino)uracil reductase